MDKPPFSHEHTPTGLPVRVLDDDGVTAEVMDDGGAVLLVPSGQLAQLSEAMVAELNPPEEERTYHVVWEMAVDAETPRKAAEKALEIHRDQASWATCFTVTDEKGESTEVDLGDDEEEES